MWTTVHILLQLLTTVLVLYPRCIQIEHYYSCCLLLEDDVACLAACNNSFCGDCLYKVNYVPLCRPNIVQNKTIARVDITIARLGSIQ